MKIVPICDKLVVKRLTPDEMTNGGIIIPDQAREKPCEGRVLSIGEGRLLDDGTRARPQISEGDRVIFSSYAGTEIEFDGSELLILSEHDILGVLE
jgi:chaperonin GroES